MVVALDSPRKHEKHELQTAKSVSELRRALRSDWAEFRRSLNDALTCRQQCQEEMIVECIDRLLPGIDRDRAHSGSDCPQPIADRDRANSGGDRPQQPASNSFLKMVPPLQSAAAGPASGLDSVSESESASSTSTAGKRARLRELSMNIQQIVRPPPSHHHVGQDACSERISSLGKAASSECISSLTADPVAAVVHGAMAHFEATIQRFEQLVAKQEQRQAFPLRGFGPGAPCVGKQGSEKSYGFYASEQKAFASEGKQSSMGGRPSVDSKLSIDSEGLDDDSVAATRHTPSKERARRMSVTNIMENHSVTRQESTIQKHIRKRFSSWGSWMEWWEALEEPPREGRLADIILGKFFDSLCAFVIIFNALFTWYTTNWEIANLDSSPTATMDVMEKLFVIFYTLELVLKLMVHKGFFFCNGEMRWNIFDTVLVLFSLCDQILTALSDSSGGGANVTFMRALRILKMAKILRGLRVLRFFYELRLMLNSLIGSFNSLLWSIVMLSLIFYVFGLIFVQGASLHLFLHREETSAIDHELILREFGSVQAAMLSLFRTCTGGDDWSYFYDIVSITGTPYALIFIFFIAFSQIAILNILTAIFVNNAMELARPDADTLAYEHRKKEFEAYEELQQLCEQVTDVSGMISTDEFAKQLKFGRLGARLAVLGISVSDAESFLELLSFTTDTNPSIGLSPSDFVEGCMRLRGHATGVSMQGIQQETRRILKCMQQLRTEQTAKTKELSDSLQYVITSTGLPDPRYRI